MQEVTLNLPPPTTAYINNKGERGREHERERERKRASERERERERERESV
jgi:hypothetical protein